MLRHCIPRKDNTFSISTITHRKENTFSIITITHRKNNALSIGKSLLAKTMHFLLLQSCLTNPENSLAKEQRTQRKTYLIVITQDR